LGKTPYQALSELETQLRFDLEENIDRWYEELNVLKNRGAHITCPVDTDYPQSLLQILDPPICLTYLGSPTWNCHPTLSVVGTRDPSQEAKQWLEDVLLEFLKENGATIVSGAARGVDQEAHKLALRRKRPTLALLPSGLGEIYPVEFRRTVDEVLNHGGALVSEYSINARMQKSYFHERNRLISGLSAVTLVVQAKIRSGSLITAHHAIRQGRTVAVVPWSPLDPYSTGTNQLLYDGASIVRDCSDLKVLMSLSHI
jgi:DNA processing protein